MNSETALKGMISRASIILLEAEYLKEKEAWNMVVRRSQEAVELALKCALLWAGIDVPHIHGLGPILKRYSSRYPEPFKSRISHFASISRMLRAEREISFYGDEQSGVPPESLYTKDDAIEALTKAKEVLDECKKLTERMEVRSN